MARGDDGNAAHPVCGPREQHLRDRFGDRLAPGVVGLLVVAVVVVGLVAAVAGANPGTATTVKPATILGTLPVDPRVPPGGIPVAFAAPSPSSSPSRSASSTSPTTAAPEPSPGAPPLLDDFGRPGAVGSTPSGLAWRIESGSWSVAGGALVGRAGHGGGAVTVAAGGGSLAFGATATDLPNGAGLVVHWKDDRNHIELLAEPAAGGWSFQATVDGTVRFRRPVALLTAAKPGVAIVLRITGDQVVVAAGDGRPTRFTLPAGADPGGDRVGFVLAGGATKVGWTQAVFGP